MSLFLPTTALPLSQLHWHGANWLLRQCSLRRRAELLPYLLARYAVLDWWEDQLAADWEYDQVGFWPEQNPQTSETSLDWGERPEILELIAVADLTLAGSRVLLCLVDAQAQLSVETALLHSLVGASLCLAVSVDLAQQQVQLLGFLSTAALLHKAQGEPICRIQASELEPMFCFADRLGEPAALPEALPALTPAQQQQAVHSLSQRYASPFEVFDAHLAVQVLRDLAVCQQVLTVRCLSEQLAAVKPTQVRQPVARAVINLNSWLQNQLDEVAASLHWVLLPPLVSSNLRSRASLPQITDPASSLSHLFADLRRQGVRVPQTSGGARHDLSLGSLQLRLYVLTWRVSAEEWSLLAVLGGQQLGQLLPTALLLQVEDRDGLVAENSPSQPSEQPMWLQVISERGETISLKVSLVGGDGKPRPLEQHFSFTFE